MTKKKESSKGPPWPAAVIEMRKLAELRERPKNPNTHSLEQIEQIVSSLRKFGWTMPMLVDEEGELIAGHGRRRAAMLMGVTEGPVIVARGWSEDMKRAYCIADNKLSRNSAFDMKLLKAEVKNLVAVDFDMELVGFSDDELGALVMDPQTLTAGEGEAEEVTMKKCPTCGRYSHKR